MARIGFPIAAGFEGSELSVALRRLRDAGHQVVLIGSRAGETAESREGKVTARIERASAAADPADFDALLLPGGHAPDALRTDAHVVALVRAVFAAGRPVAAIGHGAQLLIEAELVRGASVTASRSIRRDLRNAGASWLDQPLVEYGQLITARGPDALDAFCDALLRRPGPTKDRPARRSCGRPSPRAGVRWRPPSAAGSCCAP